MDSFSLVGKDLWHNRNLHFIGIGGAGMSGLARVALELGATVSGSDQSDSAIVQGLMEAGAQVALTHDAKNVPVAENVEVVYSTAIPLDNPERVVARERGLVELHRGEFLAQLASCKRCIAVAGTHGKTTTTAMIVHLMVQAGLNPAYVVGSEVKSTGKSAAWGSGDWIVVEADESDRSFLWLQPEIAVITNIELDHHATYASLGELYETFGQFLAGVGEAVVAWAQPELAQLITNVCAQKRRVVMYDVENPTVDQDGLIQLDFFDNEAIVPLPGVHMACNALAALHVAHSVGIAPADAASLLVTFASTSRRFEQVGETANGAIIIDDYAHHPTEVSATLAAARSVNPERLVAVFQPHLYSRAQHFASAFGQALAAADVIAVLDIYPARERAEDFPGVSSHLIARSAAFYGRGKTVYWLSGKTEVNREIEISGLLKQNDLCVMLGAGDISEQAHKLVSQGSSNKLDDL